MKTVEVETDSTIEAQETIQRLTRESATLRVLRHYNNTDHNDDRVKLHNIEMPRSWAEKIDEALAKGNEDVVIDDFGTWEPNFTADGKFSGCYRKVQR